jgi:hypothetical protein
MTTKSDNPTLDRAYDDEPIFVLRSQDMLGPRAVLQWMIEADRRNISPRKLAAAARHLAAMYDWQAENPLMVKWPD